ncbi:MAG: hypothetical protein IJ129_01125 [Ruminococcus sp.]|nr:hypothetical protein [Ruminococcus sp.]
MLCLRSDVCYQHDKDFEIYREKGYDCYLALFIRTRCTLVKNGRVKSFPAGTFVLFNKSSEHYYAADGEVYVDDWIQFESEDDFMAGMNFMFDSPVYIGDSFDLDSYFHMIRNAFYRCQNDNALIYHLMTAMFIEISACAGHEAAQVQHLNRLLDLRSRIFTFPEYDWSVGVMAKELSVSVPYMHLRGIMYVRCYRQQDNQGKGAADEHGQARRTDIL